LSSHLALPGRFQGILLGKLPGTVRGTTTALLKLNKTRV